MVEPAGGGSPLAIRATRQRATYWRVRITKTLERLEQEARRMLALEAELSAFSEEYYAVVGDAVNRLAQVEAELSAAHFYPPKPSDVPSVPEVELSREARAARQQELRNRYRALARDIHPDRAMLVGGTGPAAAEMHQLNDAYARGDLAGLLRMEAQLLLARVIHADIPEDTAVLEQALREVEQAAETYAEEYRALLNSPLNELMLRAMVARSAGWDWMDAVVENVERAIAEKERTQRLLATPALSRAA